MKKIVPESIANLTHFNAILQAIRNVNQLIVSEKNRALLIRKACNLLIETKGFFNAWIFLFDSDGNYLDSAQAGVGKDFDILIKRFKAGKRELCVQKALKQQGVVSLRDPFNSCVICPLHKKYSGRGGLASGLWHEGKLFGTITVSVHHDFINNEEEKGLFKEVADDIAYALHALEIEEKHKQAVEKLKKNEALFRTTLYSIGDAVITTDKGGMIQQMNPVAEQLTGWTESEAKNRPLNKVFKIVNEYTHKKIENPVEQVLIEGTIVGLANHTLLISRNGREIPIADSGAPIRDDKGKIIGVVLVFRDQTEERKLQQMILDAKEFAENIVATVREPLLILDGKLKVISANRSFHQTFRVDEEKTIGKLIFDMGNKQWNIPKLRELLEQILPQNTSFSDFEVQHNFEHIGSRTMLLNARRIYHVPDKTKMILLAFEDISERRQAEQEIIKSKNTAESYLNIAAEIILALDAKGNITLLNESGHRLLGYKNGTLIGKNWFEVCLPKSIKKEIKSLFNKLMQKKIENVETYENLVLTRDGTEKIIHWHNSLLQDDQGNIIGTLSSGEDFTERKQSQEALRKSEEQLRFITENTTDNIAITTFDLEAKYIYVNPSVKTVLDYDPQELIGKSFFDFIHPDDKKVLFPLLKNYVKQKIKKLISPNETPISERIEFRFKSKSGNWHFMESTVNVVEKQLLAVTRDITKRKQVEAERERLNTAIEQSVEAIVITDTQGNIQYINPSFEKITGYSRVEVLGQNPRIIKSGEQGHAFYKELWDTISGGQVWKGKFVNRRKDGQLFSEEATISPIFDTAGNIINYVAVKRDVTKEEKLERQFQQAQKMESVGRLAGGVAHDFNNMLSVILGYSELVLSKMDPADKLYNIIQEINKAGQRSADLTTQLLAFSRKQTIAPKPLDLNDTVSNMLKMLRRLIGEDINMLWIPGANPWKIHMDPAQIDQILANLCVNARDAIKDTGQVVIETDNVTFDDAYCQTHAYAKPGAYIMLAVSDDGCGIDGKIKNKIFEPFFTTKAQGEGTGLGLATVYGIVKQNEGLINVYSEPGQGTSFKIYFPRYKGEDIVEKKEKAKVLPEGHGELILLVEDETAILEMVQSMLESIGYSVITAKTPREALHLVQDQTSRIELLMTDVVMPGMNGKELAIQLHHSFPDMKVVFMSGYTSNVIAHRGVLDKGVNFITKPFSLPALAEKLHEVLKQ